MKAFSKIVIFIFLGSMSLFADAQCNPDALASKCNATLGTYTFLKSYKLDPVKAVNNAIEYSYVFSKDTEYILMLCEAGQNDVVVTLYDQKRKELASNFDKKNNKVLPGMGYKCSATGVYYMTFAIKDAATDCGISVLGFKK